MRRCLFLAAAVALLAPACSSSSPSSPSASALRGYLRAVEPVRLRVNDLLEGADPILEGYRDRSLSPADAGAAMDRLERRFADDTVAVAAIRPSDPILAGLHAPYAHTYVLEDAYLAALAAALPGGDFSSLPNTQAAQRATIIGWRTQLTVLAHDRHVHLPPDLQQAGRGEIAPAVGGS